MFLPEVPVVVEQETGAVVRLGLLLAQILFMHWMTDCFVFLPFALSLNIF